MVTEFVMRNGRNYPYNLYMQGKLERHSHSCVFATWEFRNRSRNGKWQVYIHMGRLKVKEEVLSTEKSVLIYPILLLGRANNCISAVLGVCMYNCNLKCCIF